MEKGGMEEKQKSYLKMRTQTEQIRYEFTNQDTIVLRKNGMYHKAMGNSAVMLKALGVKTKIRSGYDPVTKQEVLEMSIHVGKIEETKSWLKTNCGNVLRDDGEFFIVRLTKPIEAKQLRKLKQSDDVKNEVTEDILTKRRKETPLAKEVRELFKEAACLVRDMKGTDGMVLGQMILKTIMRLQQAIRAVLRDENSKETRQAAADVADDLQGLLLLVPNFTAQSSRLTKMGRSLNKISSGLITAEPPRRAAHKAVGAQNAQCPD